MSEVGLGSPVGANPYINDTEQVKKAEPKADKPNIVVNQIKEQCMNFISQSSLRYLILAIPWYLYNFFNNYF